MGSSVSSYYGPTPRLAPPPKLHLVRKCGVSAFRVVFEFFTNVNFEFFANSSTDYRKNNLKNKKLGHKDITKLVKKFIPGVVADYRYFSPKRYLDIPFTKYHSGVVALKFKNSNATHWLPIIEGEIIDSKKPITIRELHDKYDNFDGFGHTVLYLLSKEAKILGGLRTSECDRNNCRECYRDCKKYNLKFGSSKRRLNI